ncbi:unnamed protein product [Sphenostylis stenocarpa]|uniref:Calcium-dependent protein kinase n=1 Tax=Sphenostylis stenocarpa TaxID=92480 RepID=A0AA86TAH0_9FABA|nr:unnamed protein product [Sphenostylis stenocarpa]
MTRESEIYKLEIAKINTVLAKCVPAENDNLDFGLRMTPTSGIRIEAVHGKAHIERMYLCGGLTFEGTHISSVLSILDTSASGMDQISEVYTDIVGNAYYVAPEVLKRSYGKEIDVWNAGVILYILLSGVPPFWAESEKVEFVDILGGKLDMDSQPWPSISDAAKDLIRKMLTYDRKERITAAEALEHPWLKEDGEASEKHPDSAVLMRMKRFKAMNQMKKLALKAVAENLSEEETKGLRQMFNNMDTDGSGTITFEELKSGLSRLGSQLGESEIRQLMNAIDIDKTGTIDYCEFVAATMDRHKLEKGGNLLKAFQYFDMDDNGYITKDELTEAITGHQMGDEVFEDVDSDKLLTNNSRLARVKIVGEKLV